MVHFRGLHLIPIFVVYFLIVYLMSRKKQTSFIKQLINFSFFIYTLWLVSMTLLPIPIDKRLIQNMIETNTEAKNIFVPFMDIYRLISINSLPIAMRQFIGNIILFLPLGFYAPLMWTKVKFKKVILIGVGVSLGIEVLQLVISIIIGVTYRSFVVDDIILNTIGVILGYFVLKIILPMLKKTILILDGDNENNKKLLNI